MVITHLLYDRDVQHINCIVFRGFQQLSELQPPASTLYEEEYYAFVTVMSCVLLSVPSATQITISYFILRWAFMKRTCRKRAFMKLDIPYACTSVGDSIPLFSKDDTLHLKKTKEASLQLTYGRKGQTLLEAGKRKPCFC